MNEQENIQQLIYLKNDLEGLKYNSCASKRMEEAFKMAIEALEKQIPKKPIDTSKNPKEWHIMSCPSCGRAFWNSGQFMRYMPKWCEKCGQHIDWTVEE